MDAPLAPPPAGRPPGDRRSCPRCSLTHTAAGVSGEGEVRESAFCPHCGAVLRSDAELRAESALPGAPSSLDPLSLAPDTEQSAAPRFLDEGSSAPDKTIAEDGEPPSLLAARASGELPAAGDAEKTDLEVRAPMPTPSASNITEAPLAFMPAPERLSAPESWLRPSRPDPKVEDAAATAIDKRHPEMDALASQLSATPAPVREQADRPGDARIERSVVRPEKTVDDLPDDAKQALAAAAPPAKKLEPMAKGTTAPHLLPGHQAVEQMLSIRARPSMPIHVGQTIGRLVVAMILSTAAAIAFGFLRETIGPELVKALSLDPRGNVLNVAFSALFVLTSVAVGYGIFRATSKGWRRPKWGKV